MRFGAEKIQSIADVPFLMNVREKYHIHYDIVLLAPFPDKRACYPRLRCIVVNEFLLKLGLRLPLHPFFRAVLRLYGLAPTQVVSNAWAQLVGSYFLWKETLLDEDLPIHIF